MTIQHITHFLNGFLMVAMPISLGIYLARRFRVGWRLWWIGAATFILSQIGHIPFNVWVGSLLEQGFTGGLIPLPQGFMELVTQAVFLGLSAGLWEEVARYAVLRWWAKDARSSDKGLMLGAGHGGIEAVILGVVVLVNYAFMVASRSGGVSGLIPADQMALFEQQAGMYWSMSWYMTLLGALERLFAIIFHLSASLMVLQVFLRKQIGWLWLAILWYALLDALAFLVNNQWGPLAAELVLGWMALLSLAIIIWLFRSPQEESSADSTLPDAPTQLVGEGVMSEDAELPVNLDNSRFDS